MDKKLTRKRRAAATRHKIRSLGAMRLCVNKTHQHVYAQVIERMEGGDKVLASASTLDKEVKAAGGVAGNIKSATAVGTLIAQRAMAAGVKAVAFDRSGFKYHGCVKALAEAAREAGLSF